MSLGVNLKQLRQEKGWTQGDLSKASGVKLGHVSRLERDDTDPKLSTIYKLLEALDCSPDTLLMDENQVGISARMKAAFDRADNLVDEEKEIVLNIIDKYCTAAGMEQLMESKRFIIGVGKK